MKHFFFIELLCFVVNFPLDPRPPLPPKVYSESFASLFITFVKEWTFGVLYFVISLISLLPIFKLVCLFSSCWFLRILSIFWIQVISLICKWQIFSPIDLFGVFFHSLNSVLFRTKVFNFNKVQHPFFFISFMDHTFDVSKTSLTNSKSCRFYHMLSSISVIVLHFIFRSMNHFELSFVKGVRSVYTFIFFFLHIDVQLFQ